MLSCHGAYVQTFVKFDSVGGVQGVLSKDAFAPSRGLTVFLSDQQIKVRLVDTTATTTTAAPTTTTRANTRRVRRGTAGDISSAQTIVAGQWYHVVVSCGVAGLQLHVDGISSRRPDLTSCLAGNTNNITFGAALWDGVPSTPLLGSLDNVAVVDGQVDGSGMLLLTRCALNASDPRCARLATLSTQAPVPVTTTTAPVVTTTTTVPGNGTLAASSSSSRDTALIIVCRECAPGGGRVCGGVGDGG